MPKPVRVVIPGVPHHVTQRDSRRMKTFFEESDYAGYKALLAASCRNAAVAVWGYCLMPNHVHLILVPQTVDGLRRVLARANKAHAERINRRNDWKVHLWQRRYASVAMDNAHLLAAARYVKLNPVRAGLCRLAGDWPWSSARAHLCGLVDVAPLLSTKSATGGPSWHKVLMRQRRKPYASTSATAAPSDAPVLPRS
jgi:putative transposase